jgi:predicted nucleic acid-binding protein
MGLGGRKRNETLIEQARLVAQAQHKTLNGAFREWLEQYAAHAGGGAAVDALRRRLRHVRSSGPYTRDEMSDRFFLDTNIFVYAVDHHAPAKAKRAARLVRRAVDAGERIVSFQVLQEFFHTAFRPFSQPMTGAEAEQDLVTVLRPLLAFHSSLAIYVEAMRIVAKHRFAGMTPLSSPRPWKHDARLFTVKTCCIGERLKLCRLRIPWFEPTRTSPSHPGPSPSGCYPRSALCRCAGS